MKRDEFNLTKYVNMIINNEINIFGLNYILSRIS